MSPGWAPGHSFCQTTAPHLSLGSSRSSAACWLWGAEPSPLLPVLGQVEGRAAGTGQGSVCSGQGTPGQCPSLALVAEPSCRSLARLGSGGP